MHVYSELIEAQLENKASDPAPGKKGRIYHKSPTEPMKVDDGASIHKVITDITLKSNPIIAMLRDALYPVGEVKEAMMTSLQFSEAYGDNWHPLDGTQFAVGDFEELADLRPEWVSGGFITLPDTRNMTLKGLPDGRSDSYADLYSRSNAIGSTQASKVGQFTFTQLGCTTSTGTSAPPLIPMMVARVVSYDSALQTPTYVDLSNSATSGVHAENVVQNIGVNFFIKVK